MKRFEAFWGGSKISGHLSAVFWCRRHPLPRLFLQTMLSVASSEDGAAVPNSGGSIPFWKLEEWVAIVESKHGRYCKSKEWYPAHDLRSELGINAWLVGRASKNELKAAFALVTRTLHSRATVDLVDDLRINVHVLQRHGSHARRLTRRERSFFQELGGQLRRIVRARTRVARAEVYKSAYISNPPRSVKAEKPSKKGLSVAQASPSLSKRQRRRTQANELKSSILLEREGKKLLRHARRNARRKKQKAAAKAKGNVAKQTRHEVENSVDASVDWESSKRHPDMPAALVDAATRPPQTAFVATQVADTSEAGNPRIIPSDSSAEAVPLWQHGSASPSKTAVVNYEALHRAPVSRRSTCSTFSQRGKRRAFKARKTQSFRRVAGRRVKAPPSYYARRRSDEGIRRQILRSYCEVADLNHLPKRLQPQHRRKAVRRQRYLKRRFLRHHIHLLDNTLSHEQGRYFDTADDVTKAIRYFLAASAITHFCKPRADRMIGCRASKRVSAAIRIQTRYRVVLDRRLLSEVRSLTAQAVDMGAQRLKDIQHARPHARRGLNDNDMQHLHPSNPNARASGKRMELIITLWTPPVFRPFHVPPDYNL